MSYLKNEHYLNMKLASKTNHIFLSSVAGKLIILSSESAVRSELSSSVFIDIYPVPRIIHSTRKKQMSTACQIWKMTPTH